MNFTHIDELKSSTYIGQSFPEQKDFLVLGRSSIAFFEAGSCLRVEAALSNVGFHLRGFQISWYCVAASGLCVFG